MILEKKCGYVSLLGRPNAGKSTLMNACVGQKVAIVSQKPQTTRNKIMGIALHENSQILFLDTPGIHKVNRSLEMNRKMNKLAWSVLSDSDVVCYLVDVAVSRLHEEDTLWISEILKNYSGKVLIVATKSDKLKKFEIEKNFKDISNEFIKIKNSLKEKNELNAKLISEEIFLHSSKVPNSVKQLKTLVAVELPLSPWLFPEDELTDKPQKFICSELVREQLFRQLGQELPYKMAVKIDKIDLQEKIHHILATIIVERESQKSIVLGKKGERIQSIGKAARESLENHFQKKVYLELFVKVQDGWTHESKLLQEYIGFENLNEDEK